MPQETEDKVRGIKPRAFVSERQADSYGKRGLNAREKAENWPFSCFSYFSTLRSVV